MCSVAVDFAKHGESVSRENYADMKEIIEHSNPDFLERANLKKPTFESEGVLGQLYRDVCCTEPIREFMTQDWLNAVRRDFQIDPNIIGLVGEDFESIVKMHSYLDSCFCSIVNPMQDKLKKIMSEFWLCCEGQFFYFQSSMEALHPEQRARQTNLLSW